jgi:hypothetical protein
MCCSLGGCRSVCVLGLALIVSVTFCSGPHRLAPPASLRGPKVLGPLACPSLKAVAGMAAVVASLDETSASRKRALPSIGTMERP